MVVILSGWVSGHAFGGGLLFNVIGLPAALLYALPSSVTQSEVPQRPAERVQGKVALNVVILMGIQNHHPGFIRSRRGTCETASG